MIRAQQGLSAGLDPIDRRLAQAAIAGDVGDQHGSKPAFDASLPGWRTDD
jgi:hypothetical protein